MVNKRSLWFKLVVGILLAAAVATTTLAFWDAIAYRRTEGTADFLYLRDFGAQISDNGVWECYEAETVESSIWVERALAEGELEVEQFTRISVEYVLRSSRWSERYEFVCFDPETRKLLACEVQDASERRFMTVWWPGGKVREQLVYYDGGATWNCEPPVWWWRVTDNMTSLPEVDFDVP